MLKKVLIFIFLGVVSLQGSPRELDQSEINLQGSLSFADIIHEAEGQLGVQVSLPLKADDGARMDYNQVITLRQLAQAVVVHFAQDDIPLSWNYKSNVLKFERKDLKPKTKQWAAKEPDRSAYSSSSSPKRYPVPTIRNSDEQTEFPSMPKWAQEEAVSKRINETTIPISELPTLTQSGVSPSSRWNLGGGQDSRGGTSNSGSLPTISRDQGAFPVKIPSNPAPVFRAEPQLDTFESPAPSSDRMGSSARTSHSTTTSSSSSTWGSKSSSRPSTSQPSSIGTSPSYRSPNTQPTQARRGDFGITPYPEGAVAFINDAPSIVPGAAKEGFIEWTTRLRGAIREGNRIVLEAEEEELERRLRWLKEHLR